MVVVLVAIVGALGAPCSNTYENCIDSLCCASPADTCLKRVGKPFAMCKPLAPSAEEPSGPVECVDTDEWQCPGWWLRPPPVPVNAVVGPNGESCSGTYENCFTTRCCSLNADSCMRRPGEDFALCKPWIYVDQCLDSDEWLCPGWWNKPDPHPPPPPPLDGTVPKVGDLSKAPELVVGAYGDPCSNTYENCIDTLCCSKEGDSCLKRVAKPFAMCTPGLPVQECADTDEWHCPGWWLKPPPVSADTAVGPDGQFCSGTYENCYDTHCCSSDGDSCLRRPGQMTALCKPWVPADECEDSKEWLCPGWWDKMPPPPPPILASSKEKGGVIKEVKNCAADYSDCTLSQCCQSQTQACFQSVMKKYAVCKVKPLGNCIDGDYWLCPGWWMKSGNEEEDEFARETRKPTKGQRWH